MDSVVSPPFWKCTLQSSVTRYTRPAGVISNPTQAAQTGEENEAFFHKTLVHNKLYQSAQNLQTFSTKMCFGNMYTPVGYESHTRTY